MTHVLFLLKTLTWHSQCRYMSWKDRIKAGRFVPETVQLKQSECEPGFKPTAMLAHTRAPALALLVSSSLPSPRCVNQNFNGLQTTQPHVFVIISSMSRKQWWNSPNKAENQTLNSKLLCAKPPHPSPLAATLFAPSKLSLESKQDF